MLFFLYISLHSRIKQKKGTFVECCINCEKGQPPTILVRRFPWKPLETYSQHVSQFCSHFYAWFSCFFIHYLLSVHFQYECIWIPTSCSEPGRWNWKIVDCIISYVIDKVLFRNSTIHRHHSFRFQFKYFMITSTLCCCCCCWLSNE